MALISTPTLADGSHFGHYVIQRRLGAGGMGEVYCAKDTRLGREVALKTIRLERSGQSISVQRFQQEARSASSLNHPNIVTIYELGEFDSTHFIAMELLTGATLRDHLLSGPLPFHKVIHIATQLGDALAKAHEIGVIHRDIKPENVMLSTDDVVKLVDFGLAKLVFDEQRAVSDSTTQASPHTHTGAIIGSFFYMSPEQARGEPVDFRSDQFSFGSLLFELITGRQAFKRGTPAETLVAIMNDEPAKGDGFHASIPAPFIWIVERCLAKNSKDRYESTRDLARDLAAIRDRVSAVPAPQPLTAAAPRASNLPIQRTPFIGREQEAKDVRDLLLRPDMRLITLTGPGGIGKTRLALHVAGELTTAFLGGVHFVQLAATTDADSVVTAIAEIIGVRQAGAQPVHELLEEHLRNLQEPTLLLLDNFEHLLAAAPRLAEMISMAPNVKVVVTSQSPLHVYGEQEFPVPPLKLPDPGRMPSLEQLRKMPSVALFVERAQAVKRDFDLTRDNAKEVAMICHRLDGLPLAIELAAARIKLLSPAAMQSRIQSSLSLLTGGARDLPTRQQTLRGTLDWSYNLLNESEQKLFRRLAVFVGGFTFEGVEAVCDTRGDLGMDVLDGVASMMDKSLVRQINSAQQEPRFLMLSTIREYALERLAQSADEDATRKAHAAYCIVLAEESTGNTEQSQWLSRFDQENGNFRAALDWLTRAKNADWALRLGAALFRFWEAREYLTEGRERLAAVLALPGAQNDSGMRARALFASGVLAGELGDYDQAHQMFTASLNTSRAVQDHYCVAVGLNAMAVNARDRGDIEQAASLFEESLGTWRELGDNGAVARGLSNLANIKKMQQDYERAHALYDECALMFHSLGDPAGTAWSLNYKGDLAREQGDWLRARELFERSLQAFRELHDEWGVASTLQDLGNLSREEGDFTTAHRLYTESVQQFQELSHQRGVARVLEGFAALAAQQGHAESALLLAGAAAALRQKVSAPLTPAEQAKLENSLALARQAVGNDRGVALYMKGWEMNTDEAIGEALNQSSTTTA